MSTSQKPSQCFKPECFWLWSTNNKYSEDQLNPAKIGKWMIFVSKCEVDKLWEHVKKLVDNGSLWNCKVSTSDPADKSNKHVIIIYTKDYEDIDDVICVLDCLEASGIKDPSKVIHYKTDNQTRAGVYAGGKQKASIYSSNTIRSKLSA